MPDELRKVIKELYYALPRFMRREPASKEDVASFEQSFRPMPEPFRWFLLTCGGGIIGSEYIDDIKELALSHAKYDEESRIPGGWTIQNVFIIGWDGSGNPYGIDETTAKIMTEDHHFGGVHEVAVSLEVFLLENLQTTKA